MHDKFRWTTDIGKLFLTVVISTSLLSCGGGGSSNSDPTNPGSTTGGSSENGGGGSTPPPPIASADTIQTVTTIDPNVPIAAASAIKKVSSIYGQVEIGTLLTLPSQPANGESLVFANDGQNRPILIAIGARDIILSTQSTALAMVRIATDSINLDSGVTASEINTAITSSPSFPSLKISIDTALKNGTPPYLSNDVLMTVWAVANEAVAAFSNPGIQLMASSVGLPKSKSVTFNVKSNKANTALSQSGLPYYFWNKSPSNKFWASDSQKLNYLQINNLSLLVWRIDSRTNSGTSVYSGAILPATVKFLSSFIHYDGSETKLDIPGSDIFRVTLSQNRETQTTNGIALAARVTNGRLEKPLLRPPLVKLRRPEPCSLHR